MKIAVIGGGFTGLVAAYQLTKDGHSVTLFEKENALGGLAYGFKQPNWDWFLEGGYHHWFTNDHAMFRLIKELGLIDKLIIKRPITANYIPSTNYESKTEYTNKKTFNSHLRTSSLLVDAHIYQFDSPMNLVTFPFLGPVDKLRTATLLAFCKLNPFWQPLERVTAKDFFSWFGGKHAWEILWEPLMVGKFGDYADKVAASWLWARIKKRTPRLAYMEGGFHTVVEALESAIIKNGGKIFTSTAVESIKNVSGDSYYVIWKKQKQEFDKILLTIPTPPAISLLPKYTIPNTKYGVSPIPHLHAQALILETKEPILKNIYWLSITDRSFPFLAVVAHTNFMDKKYYGGHHITYFGNYLPQGHPYLSMNKEQLLKEFFPFIKKLSPYNLQPTNSFLFVGPFAQPVHEVQYSKKVPQFEMSVRGVYLANIDSIYPWDRGTNYAVELGRKAAEKIT